MLKQRWFMRSLSTILPRAPLSKQILKSEPTAELLEKLCFFKKTQSGIFHMLPAGMKTTDKFIGIIQDKLQTNNDASLVSLSSLSPKSLWQTTDRWANSELFKLKDSKKNEYCLVATCEEDITELMKSFITSYKDMPALVYQVGKKYRDELRPRSGLLRAREFIMMDAYSFASDESDATRMFEDVNKTFLEIFQELKIPVVRAYADSGDIGGDQSIEYHLPLIGGESTILSCNNDSCKHVATDEKALSYPVEEGQFTGDVCVKYGLSEDHTTLVCYYYPKGRQINWNLAKLSVDDDIDSSLRDCSNQEITDLFQKENEDMMFTKVLRVMDSRINSRSYFPDFPLKSYLKNNFGQIDGVSIVTATDGEICGQCNEGTLVSTKSIEVAHTFNLDTKYSKPLSLKFMDRENNSTRLVKMGCYGIGVTRVIASIAELTRDIHGLRWPVAIAPWSVSIVSTPQGKNSETDKNYGKIVSLFKNKDPKLASNIMTNLNRTASMGTNISLSHSIGIPLTIIVGNKSWPRVEIEVRGRRWSGTDICKWEEEYPHLKEEYQWEVNNASPIDPYHEKHIVLHKHVVDVVKLLLQDL